MLTSAFYSFEVLHCKNTRQYVHWLLYLISVLQTFCSQHINITRVFCQSIQNPFSLSQFISDEVKFGSIMSLVFIQLIGLVFIIYLKYKNKLNKSNLAQMILNFLFHSCLANFTMTLDLVTNLQQNTYRTVGIISITMIYAINLGILNFTLNSKRIWPINQLFLLDILRLVTIWFMDRKYS